MTENLFILLAALIFFIIYPLMFKTLPGEKWQIFAVIPLHKTGESTWQGVNITYYGLITATGCALAAAVFILMMAASGVPPASLFITGVCLFLLFTPLAKIMAFLVERKKHTLTIGGSIFAMLTIAPLINTGLNSISDIIDISQVDEIVFLASFITAYAFGEGFGRLACISFGCCYGREINGLPVFLRRIFSRFNFVFTCSTKKISYASGMAGVKTVPVQAITAVLYTASGLGSLYLFLKGFPCFSFFLSLIVTQLWRFFSEFLRADFRGAENISAYQVMSLVIIPYYIIYFLFSDVYLPPEPVLSSGLVFLWNPAVIIIIIALWSGILLYTGISSVTGSTVRIYVNRDRI